MKLSHRIQQLVRGWYRVRPGYRERRLPCGHFRETPEPWPFTDGPCGICTHFLGNAGFK